MPIADLVISGPPQIGIRSTSFYIAGSFIGDAMYLLFIPSLFAVAVIGFIQLRDQFTLAKSEQSDTSGL